MYEDVWITYFCWSNWKIPVWEKPSAKTLAWSYDLEGHARKRVERYCELANKKVEQLFTVSHPCLDDHQVSKEELKSVGDLSEVCSQIVLKCWYLTRIGRHDILWFVNKLARSITKWTQACDKRLARLISNIHHTNDYRQFCHMGNTAQHCRRGLFEDSDFASDLEDSKSMSGGVLCIFGSRTFVPMSWMRKKQTSVSHSSTESDITSPDAGLRMDGLLALDLWDIEIEVLRSSNNTVEPNHDSIRETCARQKPKNKTPTEKRKQNVDQLSDADYAPTNTHSSQKTLICTFLKTMKLSSKWFSKLRLIGCLTGSI